MTAQATVFEELAGLIDEAHGLLYETWLETSPEASGYGRRGSLTAILHRLETLRRKVEGLRGMPMRCVTFPDPLTDGERATP